MTGPSGDGLDSALPGERWVIRHRLPDGSATDLTGWLEALTPDAVQLTTVDQQHHVVERSTVIVARRAPAARGGPDPRRVSAAELERRTLPGWLAEHEPLGEWTLRSAGGFTGRANSCLAVGDPGMPWAQAADRIVAYAEEHGIEPRAQVVRGSGEEAELRALGWVDCYVPTDVLAVRLADLLASPPPRAGVRVVEELEPAWWAAYQQSRPNSADPVLLRMILDGNPPRAFASAENDQAAFAIARGHLSGDWLGLASIWTREEYRRRGWATAMMIALGHWAARRGARYGYLQVAAANLDAITAYHRLGFVTHHGYRYLTPGEGQTQRTRSVGA
ncbi:MAG TPA: GNAT family N-acetyltransferase [Propionibacteriaceae bacterium]|nr:GNAT family N-acetyltransferase [Propionibacteriaceae bacterium]